MPAVDAVIGNVPFADLKLEYQGQRHSLHDFFILKSLDALKPGGVMAVVTSHYGSVANYRKQESLDSQVIDFPVHDFRILPRKGNFATEPIKVHRRRP